MPRIWIQGAGEMASGVAVVLAQAAWCVTLAERAEPLAVRRRVSFSEAVHKGRTTVASVEGRLVSLPRGGRSTSVQVVVDPGGRLIPWWAPLVVVDARMTKKDPEPLPDTGVAVIGLGPGFDCGRNADLVIETHRPAGPGRVITEGGAAPDTGRPGEVGGQTMARLLRAPCDGRWNPAVKIGDQVRSRAVLGRVADEPVLAAIDGCVRGLAFPDTELSAGEKVGDIDPRGADVDLHRVSGKALAIGKGVLEGLKLLGIDVR